MLLHLFHSNIVKTIQLQVQFGLRLIELRSFIWQVTKLSIFQGRVVVRFIISGFVSIHEHLTCD